VSKITQITLSKTYKKGLANYSSLSVGMSCTWEFEEGEEIDYPTLWKEIDEQVVSQSQLEPWTKVTQGKSSTKVSTHFPNSRSTKVADYGSYTEDY